MALTDAQGRTPLHYAAAVNDSGDIYRILEELGSDVYKEDMVRMLQPYIFHQHSRGTFSHFQNGHTPEYYLSNRDQLQHSELLDFVKGFQNDTGIGSTSGKHIMQPVKVCSFQRKLCCIFFKRIFR